MTYRISKSHPIPVKKTGRQRKYPWPDMEVGDSFFVSPGYLNLANVGNLWAETNGIEARFICREVTEGKKTGHRVWRVE